MIEEKDYEYAALAAYEANKDFDVILNDMTLAREKYGIPFSLFLSLKLFGYSEKNWRTQGEKYQKTKDIEDQSYSDIGEATGWTKAKIDQNLAIINQNPFAQVDLSQYAGFKMYDLPADDIEQILKNIRQRRLLHRRIQREFKAIDENRSDYSTVSLLINEYFEVTKDTLLDSDIEEYRSTIEKCASEVLNDKKETIDVVADMLMCKRLMGFWEFEYFMFSLRDKSIKERREYISNIDRTVRVSKLNNRIESEILDDKYKTYQLLDKYYKRDLINITGKEDFHIFESFISKNKSFVKKLATGAMGEGVQKIDCTSTDMHAFFQMLLEDGEFVAEALIKPHMEMKRLNADSVNTVRMTTYFDGDRVNILWPWVKVGRAGSFVDNSGAGGMGVAVDLETGNLISDAMDENGNRYSVHPDNGLVFREYQIPNWKAAVDFAREIMETLVRKTEHINYVGWDITYTEDEEWVIVEGNAFPQFVQQATYGRGLKREFDEYLNR